MTTAVSVVAERLKSLEELIRTMLADRAPAPVFAPADPTSAETSEQDDLSQTEALFQDLMSAQVRIRDLQNRKELNGLTGVIRHYDPATERFRAIVHQRLHPGESEPVVGLLRHNFEIIESNVSGSSSQTQSCDTPSLFSANAWENQGFKF